MKAHSGSRGIAPVIHNLSTMEDGEWSILGSRNFTPTSTGNNPGTYWMWHAVAPEVAVSIPDGVIRIFHWHNPSGRSMVLGSTQPLNTNEYQEHFLGVKAAGA
jgi:H+/Cl- antiporter ClcA